MLKTYNDLYLDTRNALLGVAGRGSALEARELIRFVTGKDRTALVRDGHMYAPDEASAELDTLLARRLRGEPVAYILREWEFYGLPVDIDENVLIPRVDTELLVDIAIHNIKLKEPSGQDCRLLDLCCGSGCVGLAALSKLANLNVTMIDIFEPALKTARKNIKRHGAGTHCIALQGDVCVPVPPRLGKYDVIACNPPYIPCGDMETLDVSVRCYEPHIALDGGADGLDYIRAVLSNWTAALADGGVLLFEVGINQAEPVAKLMEAGGFTGIESWKDSGGIDRVVGGKTQINIKTEDISTCQT